MKSKYYPKAKNKLPKWLIKISLTVVLTLLCLILLKQNPTFKSKFYKYMYDNNISFASINKWYQSKFGSPIPFSDLIKKDMPVFNETLKYNEQNIYKDGVSLTVGTNYLVPALDDGIIIFIGEKENYGNTIILQQSNGIDVWIGNMKEININMYDYVLKGSLLGESNEQLYLKFVKDGKVLDYKDYI